MKKRVLSLLLCLVLLVGLLPAQALAHPVAEVGAVTVGGRSYALLRGTHFLETTTNSYVPFYYSDGYFMESSTEYNEHLATLSANMAFAAVHSSAISGNYLYKHTLIRQFLADIGCADGDIYVNKWSVTEPTENSIAVAIGSKGLAEKGGTATGYTLVPIAVRGGGYEDEWFGNFAVGSSGESKGFADAADEVMAEVEGYLGSHALAEAAGSGKVKFWVAGQSRGGAVANLVAKRLVDAYGTASVYAYPLEAPAAGVESEKKPGAEYGCIHNLVNYGDLVTAVLPAEMGFFRYGVEHSLVPAETADYTALLVKMRGQLAAIDPNYAFDWEVDENGKSFTLASITSISTDGIAFQEIASPAGESPNRVIGDWGRAMLGQLMAASSIDRGGYTSAFSLNGRSYASVEDSLQIMGGIISQHGASFADKISSRVKNMGLLELASVYAELSSAFDRWGSYKAGDKVSFATFLWSEMKSVFSKAEQKKIEDEKAWVPFVCLAMNFITLDRNTAAKNYGYAGVEDKFVLIGTLANAGIDFFYNHDYPVNLAWLRAADSYYDNETTPCSAPASSEIGTPTAKSGGAELSMQSGTPTPLLASDHITVELSGQHGEALFYTVQEVGASTPTETELYQTAFSLPGSDGDISYKLTVYAVREGKIGSAAAYYVTVKDTRAAGQATLSVTGGGHYGDEITVSTGTTTNDLSAGKLEYKSRSAADSAYTAYSAGKLLSVGEYTFRVTYPGTDTHKSVSATQNYAVAPKTLTDSMVTLGTDPTHTGSAVSVSVTVSDGTLLKSSDYTVSGNQQTAVGDYEVTVTGKNNYTGTVTKPWKVLEGTTPPVTPPVTPVTPSVTPVTPSVTPTGTQYAVVPAAADHGTVEASVSTAKAGESVTVTAVPESGYRLAELTAVSGSGAVVSLKKLSENSYSFSMPAAFVTVAARFTQEISFVDVEEGAYYSDAVRWAVNSGVTKGAGENRFEPESPCTRAQTVTFLWRAAGCPTPVSGTNPFTDVAADSFYYQAVLWAVENGITNGTSATTFGPDDTVNRAQVVTFLCRLAGGKPSGSTASFRDVAPGEFYSEAVLWAAEHNITNGNGDGTFAPDDDCIRGQIVTFLYRHFAA